MTTFRRTILGASVALVLAASLTAGLTGCASGSSALGALVPTAAAEAPAVTPNAAATGAATGDIVDAAQADVLLKAGAGQRAYPMADGTFVVVSKTEPLPANVQAEIQTITAAKVATVPDITDDTSGALAVLGQAQGYVSKNTGKRTLIVWKALGLWTDEAESATTEWIVSGALQGQHFGSNDAAQAAADAWVASTSTPGEYVIINVG
jgi:hypothetical protein